MNTILDYLKKPVVAAVLGFVVGLFIGLVVLGWGLWPVQWTNADPASLRSDLQEDYLRMTIDSYVFNGNGFLSQSENDALARQRYQALGEAGPLILEKIKASYLDSNGFKNFSIVIQSTPTMATSTPETSQPTGRSSALTGILVICGALILFAILGFAVYKYLIPYFRRTMSGGSVDRAPDFTNQSAMNHYTTTSPDKPIAQFMTTYVLGDDQYDDSFGIDSSSGEFLGECGINILETVGVGEPKKVTAFEVWLFDKNDIQTVTRILMSAHAFNDVATLQRLQAKGEPFMVSRGQQVVLETATLQLVMTPTDLEYGQGALPEESYFDRLTLEIVVWPKIVPPTA